MAQQNGQQSKRFSPPVHIQPTAYSVLDSDEEKHFPRTARNPQPAPSQSQYISDMSQYMRRQNEMATAAKDAQVNAALHQLQVSRAMTGQANQPTQYVPNQPTDLRRAVPAQSVPSRSRTVVPAPNNQRQTAPMRRTIHMNPSADVASTQRMRGTLPQPRRTNGLQDRISQAFKKTFAKPKSPTESPQLGPERELAKRDRQVRLVDHTVEAKTEEELLPVLGDLPELTPPTRQTMPIERRRPSTTVAEPAKVVVPTFVEAETKRQPSLRLASSQDIVGSGVQTPRVSARPKPMSYGRPLSQQDKASIFQNASGRQIPQTQEALSQPNFDRFRQLDRQPDTDQTERSVNELPQRPGPDEDTALMESPEDQNTDDTRRARSELEAEIDAIEDDPVSDDRPKFDDRTCDEIRNLLLDKSIRDISLDVSPPASARRTEMGTLTRTWTDVSGNVLATGTMVDLRRGYVILESGERLPYAKLSEADWTSIHDNWLLPSICSVGQRGSVERYWEPQTVTWHASTLCHKPLYFENRQLERYGHSRGPYLQPVHSTLHFFGSILFLPYNTAINPPNECQYSLGFYRPGNCAPWLIDPIPFSRDGIRRQALVATGLGFIP